ncbi:DUF2851 family protein [Xanthomarina sp. F2636L]|uniref:DUF2851 family protein n=1 Tax=Xanthomarina sp. F2636L TaxID=2996018 RepID=UPI00225DE8F7|nr:DUF2851 family protein [Xanthomarina sp. F2636L]MCX7550580.1 DUF2851 family protein [Xanthomarina sp. F2636L]
MQEDFIHYIWQHKKMAVINLKTTQHEGLEIVSVGQHNSNSGPDFFNAQLKIADQLWAGNVEIHIKSSDWFVHNHETDKAYDNVILHVVWDHDTEIFRKDNSIIPTLELKEFVDKKVLHNYNKLLSSKNKWINCEADFAEVDNFIIDSWLERLYIERLERKSQIIEALLLDSKNNWEAVLFKMLAKNFGLKVNGDAFFSIASSIDYANIRKLQTNQIALEALFFGQAGLLVEDIQEPYFLELLNEYQFLKQKFQLSNNEVIPIQFFRLRPQNFPTIRLSQLATLYGKQTNLFSKIIEIKSQKELYNLFQVSTSSFWELHYTFGKESKPSSKKIAKSFIDLLLINTIIPIKFAYARYQGRDINDELLELIQQIPSEKNNIISAFNSLKKVSHSALQSQALIQLKTEYCDKNKCVQCAIGNALIIKE